MRNVVWHTEHSFFSLCVFVVVREWRMYYVWCMYVVFVKASSYLVD